MRRPLSYSDCEFTRMSFELTVRRTRTAERKRTRIKDESRTGGWAADESRKKWSHQLENHGCGCLEALILLHTHTHTHALHSNVKRNLLTRREKGQRQQACTDLFSPCFFPSLPLCRGSLTYRHQTLWLWRRPFHSPAQVICIYWHRRKKKTKKTKHHSKNERKQTSEESETFCN